jgi:hypothetical protein
MTADNNPNPEEKVSPLELFLGSDECCNIHDVIYDTYNEFITDDKYLKYVHDVIINYYNDYCKDFDKLEICLHFLETYPDRKSLVMGVWYDQLSTNVAQTDIDYRQKIERIITSVIII